MYWLETGSLGTIGLYVLAIVAGVVAGAVNTLAGSGSALTLPMLVMLGLSAPEANATNRVGVLLSSLVGTRTFKQKGVLETKGVPWLIVPAGVGSIVGAIIATRLDKEDMKLVIAAVMIVLLVMIITQPNRWIREHREPILNHRSLSTQAIFFFVGLYGGFIQAGVGILLLAALVLNAHYSLVRANAIKVLLVFAFTIPALIVFSLHDQVRWGFGLFMAVGQCSGAWMAARFAADHPQANVWIRRLLIVLIITFLIRLLLPPSDQGDAEDLGRFNHPSYAMESNSTGTTTP